MPQMFDLKNIQVSDKEIAYVEGLFGFAFTNEQKKILRYWDTVDIQACPGGGKTTTLAAKLIILANKIPNGFPSGVCVITHTNVAVEEIKSKLGAYANFYFRYPNHFGTIQSFVDKFFAIPWYKGKFRKSPRIVDGGVIEREIRKLPIVAKTGTLNLLDNKNVSLYELSFNRHDFEVSTSVNSTQKLVIPNISPEKSEAHYQSLKQAKRSILNDGYFKYDEAYSIAFQYLKSNNLHEIVKRRFPIAFIDEMQDMEEHQAEIIAQCFPSGSSILQRIGDVNQAIYSSPSSDGTKEWTPQINEELQITISTRVADNIVSLVRDVCVQPQEITGWNNPTPIKPAIIVFDDATVHLVKEKFGELVVHENLHKKGKVKAIGARIGNITELSIQSYWSDFNKRRTKAEPNNLVSFLKDVEIFIIECKNTKEIQRAFLELFCRVLKLAGVKNTETTFYFTPYTLSEFLKTTDSAFNFKAFNGRVSKWILNVIDGLEIKTELIEACREIIGFFNAAPSAELKAFIEAVDVVENESVSENKIFTHPVGSEIVNIHFDTIHGVKGETHSSTLYLETFTRIYDVGSKVIPFIISCEKDKGKHRKKDAFKKRLPLAYVALTRATHFVAIAVHKDRFTREHEDYFEAQSEKWQLHKIHA
jgi:DNA helicase-2/ATP-dependent DNA helicase PcrA